MRFVPVLVVYAVVVAGQTIEQPARAVTDPGVVTTRQTITPAGVPSVFQGRVFGLTFGAGSSELWVLHAAFVYRMDWRANRVLERIPLDGSAGLQGIRYDSAQKRALVSSAGADRNVRLLSVENGAARPVAENLGSRIAGALATNNELALIPLTYNNRLAVVELATGRVRGSVKTGIAPFGAVISRDGKSAYVTNWGGRVPAPKDLTAPTGYEKDADRVVVDARGIASTGTVSRVDLQKLEVTHTIPVELHPTAIVWDEARHRVYVANSNSDSVSVIDDRVNRGDSDDCGAAISSEGGRDRSNGFGCFSGRKRVVRRVRRHQCGRCR